MIIKGCFFLAENKCASVVPEDQQSILTQGKRTSSLAQWLLMLLSGGKGRLRLGSNPRHGIQKMYSMNITPLSPLPRKFQPSEFNGLNSGNLARSLGAFHWWQWWGSFGMERSRVPSILRVTPRPH